MNEICYFCKAESKNGPALPTQHITFKEKPICIGCFLEKNKKYCLICGGDLFKYARKEKEDHTKNHPFPLEERSEYINLKLNFCSDCWKYHCHNCHKITYYGNYGGPNDLRKKSSLYPHEEDYLCSDCREEKYSKEVVPKKPINKKREFWKTFFLISFTILINFLLYFFILIHYGNAVKDF